MERILSWALLLLFGLMPAAPLFASTPTEASLPACCRRNGNHHCAMSMAGGAAAATSGRTIAKVPERCPCLPKSTAPASSSSLSQPTAFRQTVSLHIQQNSPQQAEARYRLSFSRTRQKRGPPASSL
ncbi:MAG: hypothetical protein HIU93_06005 [Acidobacteria bacterium]|nr:hypothetical protein [Acidobacteriota bacterium]MBW4045006.1 hypothetical protein [Acidobacteriota bacterium]